MLIIFFMPLLNIFSQQKVAVYVTGGNDSGLNKVLGDKLVEAFVKSGKYSAIERTNVFLEELSKEHDYQRTGNVKDDELSRLGKQFGVQFVCVAEVSDVFGEKYISARLINVESAEVIMTSNSGDFNIKTMTDLIQISSKLSQEL
jgi:curli biogenesis system outer membrane secretion channel CsgG